MTRARNGKPGADGGEVVLITGGGTGIGAATARRFAADGARVASRRSPRHPNRRAPDRAGRAGSSPDAGPGPGSRPWCRARGRCCAGAWWRCSAPPRCVPDRDPGPPGGPR
ncbi:SDR family NAD(P)-dependent oxidoreductase [Saccharopolyspora rosea]|uniref:SDR family NAD(P)-dependent oxidoreductase n=1 Tax=Saccharopolyspora rosea TaxID=524884 RepID=A0ABW3FSF9_9PSEU